ncbi:MAG TPA: hypothetical protein VMV92_19650 [Streptosporangiaceae bacterium]|nr:hypothetical protein [Streptosporangiaceae bacterium]
MLAGPALARLAAVLEGSPAVPAVDGDPGADLAAIPLRVRRAYVVLGQAVDVGQVRASRISLTWPVMLAWVYQSLHSPR